MSETPKERLDAIKGFSEVLMQDAEGQLAAYWPWMVRICEAAIEADARPMKCVGEYSGLDAGIYDGCGCWACRIAYAIKEACDA